MVVNIYMGKTDIRDLFLESGAYAEKEVTVCGWVRNLRVSKNFGFIELNDGTFFKPVQVVFDDKLLNFPEVGRLNVGAALWVRGRLLLTPEARQSFEISAVEILVEGASAPEYPIQPKRHSLEFLRSVAHLRPRTNTFSAVFRIRSLLAYAVHKFFHERGFVYVHTPIITGSDCEGAGEMFGVSTLDPDHLPRTFLGSG